MSGPIVIYMLLATTPATAALFGDRIYPGTLREDVHPLAAVYRVISDVPHDDVGQQQTTRLRRARMQIDVISATEAYAARQAAIATIRAALKGRIGTVAGINGVVVRELLTGPDLTNDRPGLSSSSIDYQVVYQASA